MVAVVQRQPPWIIVFLRSASMVHVFCVTNVVIPTSRSAVKLKWENFQFLQPVAYVAKILAVVLANKEIHGIAKKGEMGGAPRYYLIAPVFF